MHAASLDMVHPELREAAAAKLYYNATRKPIEQTIAQTRQATLRLDPKALFDPGVTVASVPVGHGQPEVLVAVINQQPASNQQNSGPRPAILHTHGGGYVMGSARSSLYPLLSLAKQLDCLIVSVEYRLAPETTYAGSIEDNYAALRWLHTNAAVMGVDPARIAVMGESAGGGHAALLAITARDRGEVPVAFQCLVYPMLDDRTGSSRKIPPFMGAFGWSAADNRFGWKSFLGTEPGRSNAPRGAVPARVASIKGLPPAFIGVGSIDLFVDEDVAFAQRLIDAGVATELVVVPGAFHGFDNAGAAKPVGRNFNATKLAALRRGLGIAAV